MTKFKPNLAEVADISLIRYPVLASIKIDGIRCTVHDGVLMSRSMKPIPNVWLQSWAMSNKERLDNMDVEIAVGPPMAKDVFAVTTSHVMSKDKTDFDFRFFVFDRINMPESQYTERLANIYEALTDGGSIEHHGAPSLLERVVVLRQHPIANNEELEIFESKALLKGYEGVMIRSMTARYKQGRSTVKEGGILKVKRFKDMEAVIVGYVELQRNDNEAFTNELGRTARSSHKDGMTQMGTLGAFTVKGLNGDFKDVVFSVGGGFTAAMRQALWDDRDNLIGRIITLKYFPIGCLDKPRMPVFKGFRSSLDMSED